MYDFGTISNEHAEKWKDEVNRYEKEMKYYLQQIQYGLDNIATLGNVHDEQRLQKEWSEACFLQKKTWKDSLETN